MRRDDAVAEVNGHFVVRGHDVDLGGFGSGPSSCIIRRVTEASSQRVELCRVERGVVASVGVGVEADDAQTFRGSGAPEGADQVRSARRQRHAHRRHVRRRRRHRRAARNVDRRRRDGRLCHHAVRSVTGVDVGVTSGVGAGVGEGVGVGALLVVVVLLLVLVVVAIALVWRRAAS